jgi:hypothetical protein
VTPNASRRPTLREFVRHAERFGVESVYETAEYWLVSNERASLAKHLRRIDPQWRMKPDARSRLIHSMADHGATDQQIGDALGISRRAAWSARTELADARPTNRVNKPENCVVFAGCVNLPVHPENFTPPRPEWHSWVHGGARVRHAGEKQPRRLSKPAEMKWAA